MPSRRDFLQSALLLPAALTQTGKTNAQDDKTAAVTFADFESGNYDGWTIEGDAFGSAPATDALFPGKIRGFGGRGFLCSLHKAKGNAATGKAISKEFAIDKPFITFKIGGGSHPGQACINLIVDSQIVRTATGDGTPNLTETSWDVSDLRGRKAHIEIVDATASTDRGYIMVDDIAFATLPTDRRILNVTDGPTLAQFGIGPKFFNISTVRFSQIYGDTDFAPVFDFGVTPKILRSMIDETCCKAYRSPHDPTRPLKETAKALCQMADATLDSNHVTTPSTFLRQWLYCEAFCAYITSKVNYDYAIVEQTLGKGDDLERYRWQRQAVEIVYGSERPVATCDGYGRITKKLANLSGIKCWHLDGTTRKGGDGTAWDSTNHGWVVFEFNGGIRVPADTTTQWTEPADYARLQAKNGWRTMPVTKRDWEIFCGEYYQNAVVENDKEPANLSLIEMSADGWRSFNSVRYDAAKNWLDRNACRHIKSNWKGCP